ncbi:MAG: DUF4157 domain-containing protein [Actinomycetota bacterium]|nr:DUF4157 domain-containing protein [Actinomycetota bacterium]
MRAYDESAGIEGRPRTAHRAGDGHEAGLAGSLALVASRAADPSAVLDLQRTAGNKAVAQLLAEDDGAAPDSSPVLDVVGRGGGEPLEPSTRRSMEGALGADFHDVRVHTDTAASASAQAVQAHAYTVGTDVVFQSDQYQPDSPDGQRMLAHELTHVIQQRNGPVEGTPTGDGIAVSHPSDSFEQAAEANADRVMSGGSGDFHAGPAGSSAGGGAGLQRDATEDEAVQGAFVQRDEDDENLQGAFVQRLEDDDEDNDTEAPADA